MYYADRRTFRIAHQSILTLKLFWPIDMSIVNNLPKKTCELLAWVYAIWQSHVIECYVTNRKMRPNKCLPEESDVPKRMHGIMYITLKVGLYSIYINASSTLVFKMCAFYAQLTGEVGEVGECLVLSIFSFVVISFFPFFIVKVSWKSFLNGFECVLPAMTLIIEKLIKPNKFQWVRGILFVFICVWVFAHWAGHCNGAMPHKFKRGKPNTLSVSYAALWIYRKHKHKQNYILSNGWRPMNRIRKVDVIPSYRDEFLIPQRNKND